MICTHCNTPNDADNVFCVNCGNAVAGATSPSMPPMPPASEPQAPRGFSVPISTETEVVKMGQQNPGSQPFTPNFYPSGQQPQQAQRKANPLIWIAVALLALIVLIGGGLLIFLTQIGGSSETLPDHLGMFFQSKSKDRVDEIRKQDLTSVLEAKTTFMKSDSLPVVDPQPNLILYADGNDISINDVRLIQIDTIKDDGAFKKMDIEAAPIDGKPAMKRIRVPTDLANGKYALAVFGEYFNEGKHKFWPFQVSNSSKSDNGEALVAMSLPLKPKPQAPVTSGQPTIPQPVVPPPYGARAAYTITNGVLLRNGPSTGNPVVGRLGQGSQVYVLSTTGNECFRSSKRDYGCGPWAQVQTSSGRTGYILSVLLR